MEIIDNNTVIVDNFEDLSAVITANNSYTHIYLGANIQMTTGIRINYSRTLLVIDGEYPQGSGAIHSLTDAGGDLGMIYKENTNTDLDITFQNLTIIGRNYFGMPRIFDPNPNVTVTYNNVTYTGPQMTWHPSGTTRYINCNITIMYAGYSPMNEVAEARWVEIGGKTTIRHNNSAGFSAFFLYKASSSFTILADAEVEISTDYDLFYQEQPPTFTIQPRAKFFLTTQRGISRNAAHRAASFLVDVNATFHYIQKGNAEGTGALFVDGAFTVNEGASVYMQADFATLSNKRLIEFTSYTASRGLYLNNPKSFVLYSRGPGTVLYFQASTPFSFLGGQVNYWREASLFPTAGTFDDSPLYRWKASDWSTLQIEGSSTSGSTIINSFNPITLEPSPTNLQLHLARVLAIGELPLIVNPVLTDGNPITGQTDSNANVKVEYTDSGIPQTLLATADVYGYFSIPTPNPLPLNIDVSIFSNVPFLYRSTIEKTQEAGEIVIQSAPSIIRFSTLSISQTPLILGRDSNEPVVVVDTRTRSTKWVLLATIDGPMRTDTGHTLPNAVVFVATPAAYEDMVPLRTDSPTSVYIGESGAGTTSITWDNDMGILLHLTNPLRMGEDYTANINWTIIPIDP